MARIKLYARRWQIAYRAIPIRLNGMVIDGLEVHLSRESVEAREKDLRDQYADCDLTISVIPPDPFTYRLRKEERALRRALKNQGLPISGQVPLFG